MKNRVLQVWSQLQRLLSPERRHQRDRFSLSEQRQSYLTAQTLPEEIIHQVLRLLSQGENEEDLVAEPGPPYFGKGCLSCRKSPDLLKVALVCWHWYYATLPLIYAHCRLSSIASLKLLCRTLTSSTGISSLIRTLSNSRIYSDSTAWEDFAFEKNKRLEEALGQLCKILPKTAEMDIEICASSLPRFAASVAASNALLTSLHIGWKGTLPKLKGGMTFPHLQNLTIEIGILTTQIMWPNMPQLRSLRIERSLLCDGSADFRPPDFTSFPPLVRVELIKTYFQARDGRDILSPGELKVGIQHLVVFNSNLPSFTIFPSSSMSHWATLRHFDACN